MTMASLEEGGVVTIDAVVDADIMFRHLISDPERAQVSENVDTDSQTAELASKIASELSSSSTSSHQSTTPSSPSRNEKAIASESCRREITVRFTSPHLTVQEAQEGHALSVGSWRISDIDNLIAGDVLDRYVARLERQAEEEERA